jgi:hypothetical protein
MQLTIDTTNTEDMRRAHYVLSYLLGNPEPDQTTAKPRVQWRNDPEDGPEEQRFYAYGDPEPVATLVPDQPAEEETPKPARTRKPRTPKPEPVAEAAPEPDQAEPEPNQAEELPVTMSDVIDHAASLMTDGYRAEVVALLATYGAKKVSLLNEESLLPFYNELGGLAK